MALWNPNKPLNQPPHFGKAGAQIKGLNRKYDTATAAVERASREGMEIRRVRSTSTPFDRGTKGSR